MKIQTCEIRYLGLISSLDLARGSRGVMSESVADSAPVPGSGGHGGQ